MPAGGAPLFSSRAYHGAGVTVIVIGSSSAKFGTFVATGSSRLRVTSLGRLSTRAATSAHYDGQHFKKFSTLQNHWGAIFLCVSCGSAKLYKKNTKIKKYKCSTAKP